MLAIKSINEAEGVKRSKKSYYAVLSEFLKGACPSCCCCSAGASGMCVGVCVLDDLLRAWQWDRDHIWGGGVEPTSNVEIFNMDLRRKKKAPFFASPLVVTAESNF